MEKLLRYVFHTTVLKAFEGSYQHLRAAAEIVFTSQLRSELPAEWQQ